MGQRLEVVRHLRGRRRRSVVVVFPDGGHVKIPIEWTELVGPMAVLRVGRRVPRLHPGSLLEVVARVKDLLSTEAADRPREKLASAPRAEMLGPASERPECDLRPAVERDAERAARDSGELDPQDRCRRPRSQGTP